ncbi:hypothetical protein LY90DRAFT_670478 [Neocallimastix californiae]|uniref:EF-hand domain-containing protein n=1 Tax=Neocallimastix californiae TaxID=1754190 RepID=A0A1Y2CZA0_9FUNG|nr:hypothetical protein LY90DRAFT_670478 [Neocallimastix californiae]|eukprot:ORY52206.1 hypothetical protein LY90DRAFT_670478 [Neocallimastix californiae]
MGVLRKLHRTSQRVCYRIVENKLFLFFFIFITILNVVIITSDNDDNNKNNIYAFLISTDEIFSIYFIFEAFISIIASTDSWKHFNTFWTYFDILAIFVNCLFLAGFPNFSAIRLWSIFKYLPRIKTLKKSLPIIRDIVLFFIFVFIFAGILGVHILGGKLKNRCVNEYGVILDEEQICSDSTARGYQCPEGFSCIKTKNNPSYNTIGFDNIFQSCLTIFQIITMEGWSDIFFMTCDSSSYWGIILYLIVIILGNWFILQLIVAVISNNLMDEIDEENGDNKLEGKIQDIEGNLSKKSLFMKSGNKKENSENKYNENKNNINKNNENENGKINEDEVENQDIIIPVSINEKPENKFMKLMYCFVNSKIMLKIRKSSFVNFIQKVLKYVINNKYWDTAMMIIIITDTATTCIINKDTSEETGRIIKKITDICTIIFAVEMICKLIMLNPIGYVKQTFFNIMDGTFTILSIIDQFVIPEEQGLFIFRILRSLRVLRVSKYSKQFQYLFEVIKDSFLHLMCLIIIWIISVVIFATFGFQLFKGSMDFDDGIPDENFENIWNSILSIIQLFTMENWNNIEVSCVRATTESYVLVPIIISIIGSFFLSNILVAIIIGAFQEKISEDQKKTDTYMIPISTLNFLKNTLGGFIDTTIEGSTNFSIIVKKKLELFHEASKSAIFFTPTSLLRSHPVQSPSSQSPSSELPSSQLPSSKLPPSLLSSSSEPPSLSPSSLSPSTLSPSTLPPSTLSPPLPQQPLTLLSPPPSKYPVPIKNLTEKQERTLSENLRIIEKEISKGIQNLIGDSEISLLTHEREEIMKKLSESGGIQGLYYKFRISRFVKFFRKLTENTIYNVIITIIIIISCVILYYDIPNHEMIDDSMINREKMTEFIYRLNVFFGVFFVLEFIIQAIAQGLYVEENAYLKDPLNWFDLVIIIISIIGLFDFAKNILILRVFRLLRIIKLIKLSLIGLSLYTGDGYTCNDPNPNITDKKDCTGVFYSTNWNREMERKMWGYFVGFDNFFDSLQTSFVLSSQEGWPDIMYYFMGYGKSNTIRKPGINKWVSIYYITSIVIGSWIFLAVVTGIAYDSIKRNSENLKGINGLNSNQKKIHEYVSLLVTPKPNIKMKTYRSKWRMKIRDYFESDYYDITVFIIIILNIIVLLLYHDEQSSSENTFQYIAEFIFLGIYTIEIILLIITYSYKYFFNDKWRILCFILVISSYIIFITTKNIVRSNAFILVRVIRMFRLFKFAKGIRALLQVIASKYKQLLNIFILMLIVIITYAFLGCYYFGDINYNNTEALNYHLNFSTFSKSLLSVFIFSTGENWPIAMADCIGRTIRFCSKDTENCGSYFSPFYFISLQILINWILLNSFIAIVVDSFIMLLQEQDEISRIELVKESFSDSWNKYDTQRKGFLSFKKFVDMYNDIEIPENFEWGSKKIKFFKTKPHISYLFKNLKVYYNYCTFTDALFCITSFWVNDDLPMNVRNALWEHNGWNKIIRKKLVIKGNTISISGQDCGIPIKEISFGAVYGIYLLQRQYKKWKSCDDLEVAYKNNITNKEEVLSSIYLLI